MNPDRYGKPKDEPGFGKRRSRRRWKPKEKFADKTPLEASDEQEDRVAARLGGERVIGSGSGRIPAGVGSAIPRRRVGGKGDVKHDLVLVECKTTLKKSISIKKEYLVKITLEAEDIRKTPAVVISFEGMPRGVERDWALVPLPVAREILGIDADE